MPHQIELLTARVAELEKINAAWIEDWENIATAAGEKPDIMPTSLRGRIAAMRARYNVALMPDWQVAASADISPRLAEAAQKRIDQAARIESLEAALRRIETWNPGKIALDDDATIEAVPKDEVDAMQAAAREVLP